MDLGQYHAEITRHAFIRAMQRKITPDMIEATVRGGTLTRFAKNKVKLMKRYKRFTVICVGEVIGMRLKIITIEKGDER